MDRSISTRAGVAIVTFFSAGMACAQPTAEQKAWIKEHAVPLKTVEAGHGFDDLQPLKSMIGAAKIVGLGEGTHGTREFFQAKHRLLEFLVEEMGFTIFSIEANMPESYELNSYVMGADGDVDALIGGMYFWTWNTEEVREMVQWMRSYNAAQKAKGSDKRVQFTGFDMQTGSVALRKAREFIEKHDPKLAQEKKADLDMLAAYNPRGGGQSGFGCATGSFPVEDARGKKIKFSGWAKTDDLKNGWAGLWWRVDGPTPRFDNMGDRGLRGTTDWTELSIEMDVPQDAKGIVFGFLMPGAGKAWFDGLKVEIDGKPWTNPEYDLDFEGAAPKGLLSANPAGGRGSPDYSMTLDKAVKKVGEQSACLASIRPANEGSPAERAKRATDAVKALLDAMTEKRADYIAATDAASADWAIQNMRVVSQWVGLADDQRGFAHRDECMAINAKWIMDQNPGAKMVIWAHNWHVRDESPWMGAHLRRMYGKDYLNLAFGSSRGKYYAAGAKGGMGNFDLAKPDPNSFEAMLETAESPIVLVDLREGKPGDPGSGWLTEERPFGGVIGALEMPQHYHAAKMQGPFDLLLYVRETTPARQLQSGPRR